MVELTQWEQEMLKKYENATDWFDVAVDRVFGVKTQEKEEKQLIPSYDTCSQYKEVVL